MNYNGPIYCVLMQERLGDGIEWSIPTIIAWDLTNNIANFKFLDSATTIYRVIMQSCVDAWLQPYTLKDVK